MAQEEQPKSDVENEPIETPKAHDEVDSVDDSSETKAGPSSSIDHDAIDAMLEAKAAARLAKVANQATNAASDGQQVDQLAAAVEPDYLSSMNAARQAYLAGEDTAPETETTPDEPQREEVAETPARMDKESIEAMIADRAARRTARQSSNTDEFAENTAAIPAASPKVAKRMTFIKLLLIFNTLMMLALGLVVMNFGLGWFGDRNDDSSPIIIGHNPNPNQDTPDKVATDPHKAESAEDPVQLEDYWYLSPG
ncbi:MAG TPA: hypothetical protein ENL03_01020, partial [Phycisphaerae bacterium]|nr:hypothetical protein [Phycisphaerae bacterium]